MRTEIATGVVAGILTAAGTAAGQSFINWESPHAHPLELTPGGTRLLAVNTADNRLEVYSVSGSGLTHEGSIPVGLDPVSVRALSDSTAWVVNHISDSVSVVDLDAGIVSDTITTGDEPADVVFVRGQFDGDPAEDVRAFVSLSQENRLAVYDAEDPSAAPMFAVVEGEDPRALATDGTRVFAAVFESGNRSTIISQTLASSAANPYPGDENPPPNDGAAFTPAVADAGPPAVGIIVKQDALGNWMDDNTGDWSGAVTWGLHDHDVAIVDAATLATTYAEGLMNANMALGVRASGAVSVVGTDAINQVRFEPLLAGVFVRMMVAEFDPANPGLIDVVDLNPHLDYTTGTVAQSERDKSIGDPRAIVWQDLGGSERAFVAGMGSNNVVVMDGAGARLDRIEVGQGPTGLALDDANDRLYVLNKFDGMISVVDTNTLSEVAVEAFFDPTPTAIKIGRPHLYDTHKTSGLGQASCASCHIDGRMDQLAWDLGDPAQLAIAIPAALCQLPGACGEWHPMKGPMATQTLFGIIGTEPLHWRGDRAALADFNPAFVGLLGDDTQLTNTEMQEFEDFVATLTFPPNPFRNFDGGLKTAAEYALTTLANGGDPINGEDLYLNGGLDGVNCVTCHTLPTGFAPQLTPAMALQETQAIKVPQLRNMYEKTGFDATQASNNRGFGFIKDGSVDTMLNFLRFPGFQFTNDQERLDVEAFLMSFSTDTQAGVGTQTTLESVGTASATQLLLLDDMVALAESGQAGLVAHSVQDGAQRGYAYAGAGVFQTDQAGVTLTDAELRGLAADGAEVTYTVVPSGSETRIALDRDTDGHFNFDELVACSDGADPTSVPGDAIPADLNGDGGVDGADLATLLASWGGSGPADLDGSGAVDGADLAQLLASWGTCGGV
jgi:DNA-binding beta-propeller fold protein YncE/mono/diheme cytochrome c family protein